MRNVCKSFADQKLAKSTQPLVQLPVEPEIQRIAALFVHLQEIRHQADYDPTASFIRAEALQLIADVEEAVRAWHSVRSQSNATVFLAALLPQEHWSR